MADERGLFVQPIELSPSNWQGTTPQQARLAMAGLVSATASFGARAGVISGCVVSGTTATAPWTYSVGSGHLATSQSAGDGVVLRAISSATTVETSPAPGSGSRIDIIYATHTDTTTDNDPVLGVAQGVASGSPVAPSIPAGAIEVGRATVPSGATNTQGATFSTDNVARTSARGAAIPVSGSTQRDTLTGSSLTNPIEAYDRSSGRIWRNVGAGWYDADAQPWAAYTPALTAATTNPTLGTGSSATGRWTRATGVMQGNFDITFGTSGTNAGSGEYFVSLPMSVAAGAAGKVIGTAWLLGSSAWALGVVFAVGGSLARIRLATNTTVNSTNPWAWGANHALRGNFAVEV